MWGSSKKKALCGRGMDVFCYNTLLVMKKKNIIHYQSLSYKFTIGFVKAMENDGLEDLNFVIEKQMKRFSKYYSQTPVQPSLVTAIV